MTKENTIETPAPADTKAEVATVNPNAGALATMTDEDIFNDGGKQDFRQKDIALPFILVLQKLSPQCDKQEPEYVPGAEPGMFFNTVTGKTFSGEDGMIVVPIAFRISITEWKLREKGGGGFVADHGSDESILSKTKQDDKGRNITADGTEIVKAGQYLCFLVDPKTGTFEQAIINLQKTQEKKSRKWNAMLQNTHVRHPQTGEVRVAPYFYTAFQFSTVPESNDKGNWFGVKIEQYARTADLEGGRGIYLAARELRAAVDRGEINISNSGLETATKAAAEDDIPF